MQIDKVYSVSMIPAPRHSCLFISNSLRDVFLLHRQPSFVFVVLFILGVMNYLFTAESIFPASYGKHVML